MSALFRGTNTAAFDGLYRRHAAKVYRYAFAVLGNHADAEDVTQSTFLNAYRALAQGVKPRKAENWLLTIAHNQVRQHFRSTLAKPREVELDDTLSGPVPDRDEPTVADVLRALQSLSPTQRSAIVMREFEGRSYAEMAEIMELTPSALEALIFRARRALAEQLEDALSCNEAHTAVSRRLDGRLPRRETRRLRAHMRECPRCARFERVQRDQRKLLKGLSVIPVPASLLLARGETAAAALGIGSAGAAAGVGATAGAGSVAGAGLALGVAGSLTAKVAAVGAAAAVAGVGYGASAAAGDPVARAERKAAHALAVAQTREGARAAEVRLAKASGTKAGPAAPASARATAATAAAAARKAATTTRASGTGAAAGKPETVKTAAAARAAEARSRSTKPQSSTPATSNLPAKPAAAQGSRPAKPAHPATPAQSGTQARGKPATLPTPPARPAKIAPEAAARRPAEN